MVDVVCVSEKEGGINSNPIVSHNMEVHPGSLKEQLGWCRDEDIEVRWDIVIPPPLTKVTGWEKLRDWWLQCMMYWTRQCR